MRLEAENPTYASPSTFRVGKTALEKQQEIEKLVNKLAEGEKTSSDLRKELVDAKRELQESKNTVSPQTS